MRILLDVTRTLVHAKKSTPTGIDRVEHAYIRYLLRRNADENVYFVVTTPLGCGALSSSEMALVFEAIELNQRVNTTRDHTPGFVQLIEALRSPPSPTRLSPLSIRTTRDEGDSLSTVAAALLRGFKRFAALVRDGKETVYLHTSHLQLDRPNYFRWLQRRGMFPVFFIHDLIPIEYPEFCGPGAEQRHRTRVDTALRYGKALIVNSEFTRRSLQTYAGGAELPPVAVAPLANSIQDHSLAAELSLDLGVPFFLHVGTIEGRKNIGHLLTVWRDIVRVAGVAEAPRLVLVGRRGWECQSATSVLDRSRELANHVIEVSNISDRELALLMRNAKALLSVSMSEGYGLPPVEAVRLGLPVVASDIPAHREILKSTARFVPVHDGAALAQCVLELLRQDHKTRTPADDELENIDWDDHVGRALSFVKAAFEAR